MDFTFFLRSFMLGVGLAMDACAVSMADGMKENNISIKKAILIAVMFGVFQAAMPLISYFVGHALITFIEAYVPWIALVLLSFLGIRMIWAGAKNKDTDKSETQKLTFYAIIVQAVATSIDALSVGFTIADYSVLMAVVCTLIVAVVTFAICLVGVQIGKKFGMHLGNRAEIFGGIVLIVIGIEIFVKSFI